MALRVWRELELGAFSGSTISKSQYEAKIIRASYDRKIRKAQHTTRPAGIDKTSTLHDGGMQTVCGKNPFLFTEISLKRDQQDIAMSHFQHRKNRQNRLESAPKVSKY
ncbi:hypothetical protein TSAR_015056 [Trichomalopsis sarcophagae]|uniref:Uncharacterized protein n=1 Tax=Trichomalopsis sarcophagae TaxID=543379 RepID=A0A232ESF8_9HYME|nr:hypothetical protein TSAR_015056 [Trichomalopsis sarcophagae]